MDKIAARKHLHELKRAKRRKLVHKLEQDKHLSGKSPRKAAWHSSAEARRNVRPGEYGAIKRSKWKRPGVPRNKGEKETA